MAICVAESRRSVRRQLPVHSPTSFRSLTGGLAAALGSDQEGAVRTLLETHFGTAHVLLTDSGTSALALAIAGSVGDAGRVAIPAYAWYDLATAVEAAGATAILYDVDAATLAPNSESLTRALDAGARAVVVVHLYGIPVDMDAVTRIAHAANAVVIEDAAQGVGGSWRDRPLGAWGDYAVLSFGRGKGLNGGGGGALLAHSPSAIESLARLASSLRERSRGWGAIARASAQWLLARPPIFAIPAALPFLRLGETIYHMPHAPNALPRASTGMLRENWRQALTGAQARRANAARLLAAAARAGEWQTIEISTQGEAGFLRLPLVSSARPSAARLRAGGRLGIMPGYPLVLSELDRFKSHCMKTIADFPGAEQLARHLVTLPTHQLLKPNDFVAIEDWLSSKERVIRAPK